MQPILKSITSPVCNFFALSVRECQHMFNVARPEHTSPQATLGLTKLTPNSVKWAWKIIIHTFRNFFNLNPICKPFFFNTQMKLFQCIFPFKLFQDHDFLLLFEHAIILTSIGSKKLFKIWFPK